MLKLGERRGVRVVSSVPSVAPYYGEAELVVVPLRRRRRRALKILEAMAYGRAIVSTTIGCEGARRDGRGNDCPGG